MGAASQQSQTPVPLDKMHHLSIRGKSSSIIPTDLDVGQPVRAAYLKRGPALSQPPLIAASPFVPRVLVAHLMRNKKNLALGVKFVSANSTDAITNLEGALHTYVNPVIPILMHGDYTYHGAHTVNAFEPSPQGKQQARLVVMSAMVHPDFELQYVMYRAAALDEHPIHGEDLGDDFSIPSVQDKQNSKSRDAYDRRLKRHLVKHLTEDGSLPGKATVNPMSQDDAVALLSRGGSPIGRYVAPQCNPKDVLSLELLFFSAIQQVVNEFSALEALCPNGYVYTFDPPAIFANTLSATLINRLFIAALGHVARLNPAGLGNLRVFAFNDYADPQAIGLVRNALKEYNHISVTSKSSLFPSPRSGPARYVPPPNATDALLVIHNNSDAFGQNIEYEGDMGSMDGALGCHSNAAACLHRRHPKLVDNVLDASMRLRTR